MPVELAELLAYIVFRAQLPQRLLGLGLAALGDEPAW